MAAFQGAMEKNLITMLLKKNYNVLWIALIVSSHNSSAMDSSLNELYQLHTTKPIFRLSKAGVSNSISEGAAGGSFWVGPGRNRDSTKIIRKYSQVLILT